jgi:hypothetical protein
MTTTGTRTALGYSGVGGPQRVAVMALWCATEGRSAGTSSGAAFQFQRIKSPTGEPGLGVRAVAFRSAGDDNGAIRQERRQNHVGFKRVPPAQRRGEIRIVMRPRDLWNKDAVKIEPEEWAFSQELGRLASMTLSTRRGRLLLRAPRESGTTLSSGEKNPGCTASSRDRGAPSKSHRHTRGLEPASLLRAMGRGSGASIRSLVWERGRVVFRDS